ncbi:MAG: putative phosphothreonine lyase domain-containing protein [Methanobacteriota archaeon]
MEAVSEIAYGLFEHYLTSQFNVRKQPLYRLVEDKTPFKEEFSEIFTRFQELYPDIAQQLQVRYSSSDEMYNLFFDGEGVIPSKTIQTYWIIQDAPETDPHATEDEKAGKWLIFVQPDQVDEIWKKIRDLTWQNELGILAKVSTAKKNPDSRDERRVIYVYTADWEDEEEVMRVREKLRSIGVIDRIGYKRNIETFKGEYASKGKRVTYYSA